jgi:lipopolysaccharide export system permease protein
MLNNKQLSYAIDSLQLRYNEKEQLFKKNMIDRYELELTTISISDSSISLIQKRKQYDIAISKIRTLRSIARSNKDDLKYKKIIITKHKIEWHRKISLSVACLLLFLIGAPLGSIIRKGGFGIPVLVSVLFFILYHVLNIIGEKSAKDLSIDPHAGMWLANFVFVPIAIFLLYKAKNDSKLFDFTKLRLFLNRITNKKLVQ